MTNDANKNSLADVPRILALSGSLRAASFSTAILRALSQEEQLGISLTVKTLEEIPLYNEDLDTDRATAADSGAAQRDPGQRRRRDSNARVQPRYARSAEERA